MADTDTTTTQEQPVTKNEETPKDGASTIVETVEKMGAALDTINEKVTSLGERVEKQAQTVYPWGAPNGGVHGVRTGEDPLTSRPYSFARLAMALRKKMSNDSNWGDCAKVELDLGKRLESHYQPLGLASSGGVIAPLATDLMPTQDMPVEGGGTLPGVPVDLVKECQDLTRNSMSDFDMDEVRWLAKRGLSRVQKDLSANTATSGGTLVGFASQGELIELLRATEIFPRVGAQEIDLPPQGSIRFPRETGSITIAAAAEGATATESTPATSHLLLQAKKYHGLVDIPEELIKFATSVAVEAWLRSMFTRDLSNQTDQDSVNGNGGTAINGVVNYSGLRTVTATTTAANGDTLEAEDPTRLVADIADQNAPIESGLFYAMTNTLWGGITTRRADAVSASDGAGPFVFAAQTQAVGSGMIQKTLNGVPVLTSTHVPTDRVKGASSNLTLLLAGVGPEWIIARAGVIEFNMTNSDASKFQSGLSTLRGVMYMDAGPRHENSFGMIDDINNS